jgi:hypothetical protein
VQYVAASAVFGSEAERDHYAATLRWRIDHGMPQGATTPDPATQGPEMLPNQGPLL